MSSTIVLLFIYCVLVQITILCSQDVCEPTKKVVIIIDIFLLSNVCILSGLRIKIAKFMPPHLNLSRTNTP